MPGPTVHLNSHQGCCTWPETRVQVRGTAWLIAAAKAAGEGDGQAVAGLALGALSSAALLALFTFAGGKPPGAERRVPLR